MVLAFPAPTNAIGVSKSMLTIAGENVPVRVALRLDSDETVVASVHGLLESGLALTGARLFAWRASGTSSPLPLTAIHRILIDTGADGDHVDIVVLPRLAIHAPMVLTRRSTEVVSTLAFVADIARAARCEPVAEELGPVHRFTFPRKFSDFA
jgi:hypothetical protein